MTNIQTIHQYRCDLNQGPCEVALRSALMHQDALGDVFRVAVWRNDAQINLEGMTVHGYLYFASTRQTLALEGSVMDGCASVALTAECYSVPGYASLVVQLQDGDVRHTVLKVDALIKRTGSESVYFPENYMSLADLLARIDEMEKTVESVTSAAAGFPSGEFSVAQITRVAGNVTNKEYWFFVNARWDAETQRFKRIDLDKNSFGIQMQAAGTYPGEETLGYTDNQAIGYWRATGRDYFLNAGDTASAEAVTEDIGVEVDGEWKEFGMYLGWNNCYMIDSYGGLTVGGAGFEIDGNGLYPYVRTSLSKWDDPAGEKGFAINGLLWNAYHKLSDSDDKSQDSWAFGLQAPIDYYHGSDEKNLYSNYTQQDKTRLVFLHRLAGTGHNLSDWHEAFTVTADGEMSFAGKIRRVLCSGSGTYVQCSYPEGFAAENTELLSVAKDADGSPVALTISAVSYTAYGVGISTAETIASTDVVYAILRDKSSACTVHLSDVLDTLQEHDSRLTNETAPPIIPTATGDGIVAVSDSAHRPLAGLTLYGKTTQDGTPTPDAPVELVSVGDGGSIGVYARGKNLVALCDAAEYTENGLTCTSYGNGKYHIAGTSSADTRFDMPLGTPIRLPINTYIAIALNNTIAAVNQATVAFIGGGIQIGYVAFNAVNRVISYEDGGVYSGAYIDTLRVYVTSGTTIDCDVSPVITTDADATYEPYADGGSVTVSTPNGLPGIPVDSGGNYTDADDQQWICDEVDFGRGVYVQRVAIKALDGTETAWSAAGTAFDACLAYNFAGISNLAYNGTAWTNKWSNMFKSITSEDYAGADINGVGGYGKQVTFKILRGVLGNVTGTNAEHIDDFKAWLAAQCAAGTPVEILYALATPIETDLSAEELTAYAAMRTQYPNTTVYNDAGAGMAVDYIADTKSYIDQRISAIAAATLNA